jgi:hypothetical protein
MSLDPVEPTAVPESRLRAFNFSATNAEFRAADRAYAEAYPEAVADLAAKLSAHREPATPLDEPSTREGAWRTVWAPRTARLVFTPEALEQVLRDVRAGLAQVAEDQEILAEINRLPEAQRARVRRMNVDAASRALLHRMATTRARLPVPSCRPRRASREGPRRSGVRAGPRRAGAPTSSEDPDPPLARLPARRQA